MEREEIINQKFYREMALDRSAVSEKDRTVKVSFSSELPVDRWFGSEILDHRQESVDLSRLKSGGAVMVDHRGDQVGVVQKAWIDSHAKKGYALLRFSKSVRGQEVFSDIQDGIRQNTSVGYSIQKFDESKASEGIYRAVSWTPLEISIVSVPADSTVGIGRSENKNNERNSRMENEDKENSLTRAEKRAIQNTERERCEAINFIAEEHGEKEMANQFIREGKTSAEFGMEVLKRKGMARPIITPDADHANIGMSGREISQFSIVKAIRDIGLFGRLEGLEKEASIAASKKVGRNNDGNTITIPHDIASAKRGIPGNRALGTTVSTAGGYTVDSDVLGGSLIELLRNKMLVSQLGAMNMSGLIGNVSIPRQTATATAQWLSETTAVTPSDQTFGQLIMTPKRLTAATAYTKELLAQSSIDVEAFVRMDLMTALAIAKDSAAISGLGAAGQPLGILNTSGVGSVTFGAAATFAKTIEFETTTAGANAIAGNTGFLTTPAVRGKWKQAVKVASYPSFL